MDVAEKVGIGVATVYRIAKEEREAEESFQS
jgi:predicted DNA-binding transcriptional regulator AlpA